MSVTPRAMSARASDAARRETATRPPPSRLNHQIGVSEKMPWCPTKHVERIDGGRLLALIDPLAIAPV